MMTERRQTLRDKRLQDEAMDEDRRRREEAICKGCGRGDDGCWKIGVTGHPRMPDGFYHEDCNPYGLGK